MKDITNFINEGNIISSKNSKKILTLGEFRELKNDISNDTKLYVDIQEIGWGPSFPNTKITEFVKNNKSINFRVTIKHSK